MVNRFGLKPDGRAHNTVLSPASYGDYGCWYSLTSPVVRYLYQDMGCLPEIAPNNETHLLRTSTQVQAISYGALKLGYRSLPDSVELLKLQTAPTGVLIDGKPLKSSPGLQGADSFLYNPRNRVLLIRHRDPRVTILFTPKVPVVAKPNH